MADGGLTMGKAAGVQPSTSQPSSFAFSQAGLAVKPGMQSCPEEPEAAQNASVHPLGFFAAEGARQLCHVEGDPFLCAQLQDPECASMGYSALRTAAVKTQWYSIIT